MSFNGVRSFRYALLFEIGANASGFVPALFMPETALSFLVKNPNMITPATTSFGVLVATGFTIPLILCYPNPVPSQGGSEQIVAWRRLTYMMFGAGEVGLGTMMMVQWLQGDSGLSDNALLMGMLAMGAFSLMRAFFLYVRPSWMEGQVNARKAQ
ncbi:hypothetical protein LTR78_009944 [Recurvomyces mirabilis]|uniref:Uncharacterized protein n=1 Tax=Recurvomyces mirabilis TaxID=574656 RepID=A0AAE0TRG0_9PEZI|nr:hypothetical protein LTR78_009944 [Recurvomyces mirabilis]KAK5160376.1 hypothetical protein LTS14_001388 [Recurvomyces mirabilis]